MNKPKENHLKQNPNLTRRRFLSASALAAASFAAPGGAFAAETKKRKSKDAALKTVATKKPGKPKINVAVVGLGVRGLSNAVKCGGANIVALCDVDWGTTAMAFQSFPDAKRYRDFRAMLDKEKSIDAVIVSTPDHTHAVVAAEAMRRGKHVYVETPLAHSVWEARELARIARETGVVTQMGNERHSSPGIRKAVEMVWGGGLGPIREAHCWTNRPQWPQGNLAKPKGQKPGPGMDWDLWLGPAPERDFDPAYHPYRWRGWRDFGTGALGAMGCQLMDVAFWGLKLGEAPSFSVEAESSAMSSETFPKASTIRYKFPARGDMPPVTLSWNDGGRFPQRPKVMPRDRELGSNGALFIGDKHPMIFGPTVFGTNPDQVGPRTIPEFTQLERVRKVPKIPTVREATWQNGDQHIQEWLHACQDGKQPSANFAYSGPLTEMVLMGNAALLSGKRLKWDRDKLGSDEIIHPTYRKGWAL